MLYPAILTVPQPVDMSLFHHINYRHSSVLLSNNKHWPFALYQLWVFEVNLHSMIFPSDMFDLCHLYTTRSINHLYYCLFSCNTDRSINLHCYICQFISVFFILFCKVSGDSLSCRIPSGLYMLFCTEGCYHWYCNLLISSLDMQQSGQNWPLSCCILSS